MSDPMRDTPRQRRRLVLLRAVEAVIAEDGLAEVQARRIALAAGCSVGTLYNVFGDIDGLILAANERTLADLGRVLTAAGRRTAGGDLGTRLMALAITYLDFATANQNRWRAVFEHRLPEARHAPPSYREDRRRLLALIETQLDGAIKDPISRSTAAYALFASVHGIVMLALDAKLDPFDPVTCEGRIRFVVDSVVRGLTTDP
jgi:AcrR family transcriptional regulator